MMHEKGGRNNKHLDSENSVEKRNIRTIESVREKSNDSKSLSRSPNRLRFIGKKRATKQNGNQ